MLVSICEWIFISFRKFLSRLQNTLSMGKIQ